ncbi:hypothetical protein, partial [Proteus mirabilis]|uniref:hypothetical protein n=2 Tax=Proteus mirabilis TaxID=584 RepID=UPI001B38E9A1
ENIDSIKKVRGKIDLDYFILNKQEIFNIKVGNVCNGYLYYFIFYTLIFLPWFLFIKTRGAK